LLPPLFFPIPYLSVSPCNVFTPNFSADNNIEGFRPIAAKKIAITKGRVVIINSKGERKY
jgi:hypothetical protein